MDDKEYADDYINMVDITPTTDESYLDEDKAISDLTRNSDGYETPVDFVNGSNGSNGIGHDISSQTRHASRDVLIESSMDDDNPGQSMFFTNSTGNLRIDYVLVYNAKETDPKKKILRQKFEEHLSDVGVKLEHEESSDGKTGCVKIHSTWDALSKGAMLMQMRKKITTNEEMQSSYSCPNCCVNVFAPNQNIVPDEPDFFTAPFDPSNLDKFAIKNRDEFFTNAERSLITKMFLDSTECPIIDDGVRHQLHKGIGSMVSHGVYTDAFPLHEGQIKPVSSDDPDLFEGPDKDRMRLFYGWAKASNLFRLQPLDYVRKYFGEKIGLYFAWLGMYTMLLIPATLFGIGVFLYGLITMPGYTPSEDICNKTGDGNFSICPLCDDLCDFRKLSDSCIYARLTHVFDNYATVALAVFMSIWALMFLEFWKRRQAELQFIWDVSDFEADEQFRPSYEKIPTRKLNPVTQELEPYLPWFEKFARLFTSLSLIVFLLGVVIVAIFAILVYRLAVASALFAVANLSISGDDASNNAKLITTVTSAILNLIVITILGMLYQHLALFATKLEKHKTFSDHEDSYTFKIIVFQFINYYGSIIYIAYFKGSFVDPPGRKSMYIFGYRQDECDPTGCFIELTIQLAIIMIGKQAINGFMELIVPAIKNCFRRRNDDMKNRKRWEDDLDLEDHPPFIMFYEYLEMVIQFGFVTLFVTAFPLAPLFALINNIIEIRLDAYKLTKLLKRPPAYKAQDIGAWYPILRGFAYIAVVTNAFIIAWTSEFIPKLVYVWNNWYTPGGRDLMGYVNDSLSVVSTTVLNITNGPSAVIYKRGTYNDTPECRFRGYFEVYQTGADVVYEPRREYWQIFFARMAFVIVFEHTCFLLMSLVAILVPDVSARIKRMRRYERQLLKKADFENTFTAVREKRRTLLQGMAAFAINRDTE